MSPFMIELVKFESKTLLPNIIYHAVRLLKRIMRFKSHFIFKSFLHSKGNPLNL